MRQLRLAANVRRNSEMRDRSTLKWTTLFVKRFFGNLRVLPKKSYPGKKFTLFGTIALTSPLSVIIGGQGLLERPDSRISELRLTVG